MTYKVCHHCGDEWESGLAFCDRQDAWSYFCAHCLSEIFRKISDQIKELDAGDIDWEGYLS